MQNELANSESSRHMMWKYVLPPVLAITLIWVAASGATTYYIQWMEKSQQRILDENVASVQTSIQLEQDIQRFQRIRHMERASPAVRAVLDPTLEEIGDSLAALRHTSVTKAEKTRMEAIDSLFEKIESAVRSPVLSSDIADDSRDAVILLTNELVIHVQALKEINQRLIDDGMSRRSRARVLIMVYRSVMQILGPLVGVWMGWRIAKRLQQWVGHLSVTLRQTDSPDVELGTVLITSDQILDDLQQQAESIVGRLKAAQSELNQSKAELLRSERLAAVGQLAAGVAHEIRNPLTSIKLLLQHASRRGGLSSLKDDQLQLILDEVERMESTIGGLLDFSRQQPLRLSHHDFRETIQRALNLIDARARHQNIQVCQRLPTHAVSIRGDVDQLHQVLVNLFINAIESMPEGGTVTVTLTEADDMSSISVAVQDSGPGIPPDIFHRLFEPFVTTRDRGTGLGLAVSRRIITQHQGTLSGANPIEGHGAVFTIELPRNLDTVDRAEGN